MCAWSRRGLPLLLALALLAICLPAHAWVETAIESDFVAIDVKSDGSAVVSHEITMKVRGGPLEGFVLDGVDADAKPFSDATVTATTKRKLTLPVLIERRDDGGLALEVDNEKGLRRGTYLWRFSYRTHLLDRGLVAASGNRAAVRWVGPRYSDGIDSVKVLFQFPPAPTPPELPRVDPEQAELGLDEDPGGVFLSSLRRTNDRDELEVVRPHVARGEPVVWRVVTDARVFAELTPPDPVPAVEAAPLEWAASPERRSFYFAIAFGVALAYALLVVMKWMALRRACEGSRARPRALVPLPSSLRGVLAGLLLVAAGGVALMTDWGTLAGVLLVGAIAFAAHLAPRQDPPLRGPGVWKIVADDVGFRQRRRRSFGMWLDAGTPWGFLLFLLALAGCGWAACQVFASSPYHALLVVLAGASLVPIFCTGRPSELLGDPVARAQPFLRRVARRLRRDGKFKVAPLLRVPVGGREPDELRLLVVPRPALPGLIGIEIGIEVTSGGGGNVALPCVLVRALEDSASHRRLSPSSTWSRGRRAEERVSVLRPKLPTAAMTAALASRLANMLTDPRRQPNVPPPRPRSVAKRSGRPVSAWKDGTTSSPTHAM